MSNKYDQIKINTIHSIFKKAVIIAFLAASTGIFFSSNNSQHKFFFITIFAFTTVLFNIIIIYIKNKLNNIKIRYGIYSLLVILLTLITAIYTYDKYSFSSSIALISYSVIIYHSLSKKLMMIQGALTFFVILFLSIQSAGETITLGYGFIFSSTGMYLLILFILLKGINMYKSLESTYNDQLSFLQDTQKILEFNIEHDMETGCLNRSGLLNKLDKKLNIEKDFSFYIVIFDISNFKYIINASGFDTGLKIIHTIIHTLIESKYSPEYISRLKGDTIAFSVSKIYKKKEILNYLKYTLDTINVDNTKYNLQSCIGIADANSSIDNNSMLRNAEMAMYHAKEHGPGSYALHDKNYSNILERRYIVFSHMKDAIKNGEFYNVYQPKVNISNNHLYGFEALVRWNSSILGPVYPDEFIPIAEKSKLIIDLGYEIMKNAMLFAKKAALLNPHIIISINLSLYQLLENEFYNNTFEYIKTTGVSKKNIAFEITETIYSQNMKIVKRILDKLNNSGIQIYLDDFGTGYSSLSYLHELPISTLKIDKRFVDTIENSEKSKVLLRSILTLSKSLNIKSIAEGVENSDQLDILKSYDCDYVQGFYFDTPISEDSALNKISYIYKRKNSN